MHFLVSKLSTVFLLLCLWMPVAGYATDIRPLVFDHINRIQNAGGELIGDISISELKAEMERVETFAFFEPRALYGKNGRVDAVNFVETKAVFIYGPNTSENTLLQNRLLMTHEFIEAAGFDDEHYQISTMIYVLVKAADPKALNLRMFGFYKSPPRITKNRVFELPIELARGGTTTGVGSGGDGPSAEAKVVFATLWLQLLERERDETGRDITALKKRIMDVQFETRAELPGPWVLQTNDDHSIFRVLIERERYKPYDATMFTAVRNSIQKRIKP
jgi:hypothetical protein